MVACVSSLTSGRKRKGERRGEGGGRGGGGGGEEGEEIGRRKEGEGGIGRSREEGERREKREEEELPVPLVSSSSGVLPSGGARTHCSIVLPWHWPVSWQEDQPSQPAAGNAAPVSFARGRERREGGEDA